MRRIVLALTGAVVSAAVMAAPAVANHSWGGYHWARTSNPFTVTLGDNVSSTWDSYLQTAAADWSADAEGNPVNAAVGDGGANPRNCRPTSGRIEVCNAAYGQTGWLGVAQIWISGTHITQGSVKVNDTYHNSAPYNTAVWRAHVMCQEVGHTFGLDHQDESGADFHTCMDYASSPDTDNMHPNTHDYAELAAIYAHLDTTTTVGFAGSANARPYRVERTDRPSRSKVVERFSDGSKRITFIYWTNAG